ncbi:M16 family metallopeptidase [Capnocytophaga sp. ARDL2]|uniref:M16 family metallopeptidase n=1 Tax=Capnocytophaga sp. ARDL2 TaxID=3238809 RepID=UPI00355605C3
MRKSLTAFVGAALVSGTALAQKVEFEQYTLDNGLHVVLHQDKSAPVVITSVMYHVGAKDEDPNKTGFAHFFEHLLFEGTENIGRGDWFKIVTANGGINNANTTDDRTYYYEVFPSNNLQLGLWMEAERMLHPVINQIGVDTQKGVIQEEKKTSYNNRPYGGLLLSIKENLYKKHPYRWQTIGKMEHIKSAELNDFVMFNEKYYIPNNAVLVVAGDFETNQAKKWIDEYFGTIPRGKDIVRTKIEEEPITEQRNATWEDPNIQIPMMITAYRTPSMVTRDARVLDMISTYLSGGRTSVLYKKIVDDKKKALQIGAFNYPQEDYGQYIIYGLPMGENTLADLLAEVDEEIVKLQKDLISERDFQKLQNIYENQYVSNNSTIEGVASNLATYYLLYKDINLVNNEIDIYRSITREEIREVAKKYLNPNQRVVIDYVPATATAQN